jgi:hypothetical protein
MLFNNPFMKEKLLYLIQISRNVRRRVMEKTGMGEAASAIVTKVLCIENGTLWHRYCENKEMLIATRRDLRGPQMLKFYSSGQTPPPPPHLHPHQL